MPIGRTGLSDPAGRLGSGVLGGTGLEFAPSGGEVPAFANVQFLAGWDGADGATSFTEESQNAQVQTFLGSAALETDQQKFGTASLLLNGVNGNAVTSPDLAAITIGAADFCVEGFMRFIALPGIGAAMTLMSHYDPATGQRAWGGDLLNDSGTLSLRFFYSTDGAAVTVIQSAAITGPPVVNTWFHFAFTREGDIQRGFFDGVQQGSNGDFAGASFHNSTHALTIGALGNSGSPTNVINGYIDESRLTIGEPVYTENFTPPTEAFPRS